MIKRNGVEVMNARTQNASIAKQTINICKNKQYTSLNGNVVDLSNQLDYTLQNTKLYRPEDKLEIKTIYRIPTIEVVNETTAQSAARLINLGYTNPVALNFASAKTPGGGFLAGAIAQEEDLCRCSGLYSCLKSKPIFYNENILCNDCYYTDNIIYSPKVPFFRNEHNLFLETPFELSIITSPAPNIRGIESPDEDKLIEVFYNRSKRLLEVAAAHQHDCIILGAWGCGAFGNDPALVATCFSEALKEINYFRHVCFAVYDTRTPPHLFSTFNRVFV